MRVGLDKWTLGRVLWRSLFLQAAWNPQGQQNLGLAAAMSPVLARLYGQGTDDLTAALRRVLVPFNTHPYMSGPILGILVHDEVHGLSAAQAPEKNERLKTALAAGFAAIGDRFYWNAWLVLSAVIGLCWARGTHLSGAVVFLIFYNLAHFPIRLGGFWLGWRTGRQSARALDRLKLPVLATWIRLGSAGLLGALTAIYLGSTPVQPWPLAVSGVLTLAGVIVAAEALKRLPVEALLYALLTGLIAWSYLID